MEQMLDGLYIKIKNQDLIDEIDEIYKFIDICWFSTIHQLIDITIFLFVIFCYGIFFLHLFTWILFSKMPVF